jgi:hypothetical protein
MFQNGATAFKNEQVKFDAENFSRSKVHVSYRVGLKRACSLTMEMQKRSRHIAPWHCQTGIPEEFRQIKQGAGPVLALYNSNGRQALSCWLQAVTTRCEADAGAVCKAEAASEWTLSGALLLRSRLGAYYPHHEDMPEVQ